MIRFSPAAALALCLAACTSYPAPPPRVASSLRELPADLSTISVPIAIRIPDGEAALGGLVPQEIVQRRWVPLQTPVAPGFEGLRALLIRAFASARGRPSLYRYALRRGPISVTSSPAAGTEATSNVRIASEGSFALEVQSGGRRFACGALDGKQLPFSVALDARISLEPDWTLVSQVTAVDVSLPSACVLLPGTVDATQALRTIARRFVDAAAQKLADLTADGGKALRDNAETFWALASQPFSIADQVWLLLAPEALPYETPTLTSDRSVTLMLHFDLEGRPHVVLGPRPAISPPPLPPLTLGSHPPEGFHVAVDARVPFDVLSREVTARLKGTPVRLGRLGTIRIESFGAYGTTGGKLAIRVGFSGAVRGDAYFVGTPAFDPATRTIAMPDLDFTVATRNLLVNLAAPIVRSQRFREMLREKATYDASQLLDRNVRRIVRGFNQTIGGPAGTTVVLAGNVADVRFGGIGIDGDELAVRAIADGTARVTIDATAGKP